jgi:hypothetical protein
MFDEDGSLLNTDQDKHKHEAKLMIEQQNN